MAWRERLAQNPSTMELLLAERLQKDGVRYTTQTPLFVSSADFYFETNTRPLVVFIDGPPHLDMGQARKDDVFRTAIRMSGYKVAEFPYRHVSEKVLNEIYEAMILELRKLGG